jgi:YebC/PmpR family DNA-binding regulatory protein
MAGHSKWANIKRQKARVDAKKANVFTKIAREIIVAARQSADPNANFQLRTAIDKAKAAGIPNDNIDRAIAKGAGTWSEADRLEAIRYEGYGPGGIAIIIEVLTDNRNRTAADLRTAFTKNNGNLGEMGCVSFMFDQKAVVELHFDRTPTGRGRNLVAPEPIDEDQLLEACLEAGADTYELNDVEFAQIAEVYAPIPQLETLSQALTSRGYQVTAAEFRWIPQTHIDITDLDQAKSLLKLIDTLEDLDDVQSVTANFDMSDDLMASLE